MKIVAAAMAASLGLVIAGCALDKSVDSAASASQGSQDQHDPVPLQLAVAPRDAVDGAPQDTGTDDAAVIDETVDPPTEAAGTPPSGGSNGGPNRDNGGEQTVRDAKEAAEDAARKIYDAAVGAATKIKEVGLGAAQSVRDARARDKDEHGVEEDRVQADEVIVGVKQAEGGKPVGD